MAPRDAASTVNEAPPQGEAVGTDVTDEVAQAVHEQQEQQPEAEVEAEPATVSEEADKQAIRDALTKIYSESSTWLRERYRDEFDAHRAELARERGIAWTPPPKASDKALALVDTLVAEHGEEFAKRLRERLSAEATAPEV